MLATFSYFPSALHNKPLPPTLCLGVREYKKEALVTPFLCNRLTLRFSTTPAKQAFHNSHVPHALP